MHNRAERRERTYKKWISRLRKLWESHEFCDRIVEIKSDIPRGTYSERTPKAETFDDFKRDRFGVLIKHTGTMFKDNKWYTEREWKKKNKERRSLSKEDKEDVEDYMKDINNPYAFEQYCGNCYFFGTNECPKGNLVYEGTNWEEVGCTKFWD